MSALATALIGAAHAATAPDGEAYGFWEDPTTWVLMALLAFLGLVWYMGGFKAITGQLDARSSRIDSELKEAERLRKEAAALLAEHEAKRAAAEAEAKLIVAQARADAETLRNAARAELDADLVRRERITEERIARAQRQALAETRAAAIAAAVDTAERLLKERMTADMQRHLVRDGVQELGQRFQ